MKEYAFCCCTHTNGYLLVRLKYIYWITKLNILLIHCYVRPLKFGLGLEHLASFNISALNVQKCFIFWVAVAPSQAARWENCSLSYISTGATRHILATVIFAQTSSQLAPVYLSQMFLHSKWPRKHSFACGCHEIVRSTVSGFDLALFSSLSSEHLCVSAVFMVLCIFKFFVTFLPLASWACWDWPLTWLTDHCPSVLWRCLWLGHLTHKIALKWPVMCWIGR